MAAGGLYHYFGGKEQLLIAICDQLMDPLLIEAEALVATDESSELRLRALVRLWVAHVIEHRDHMLVFQQERHVIEHGEQWRDVRESRKRFERLVAGVLEEVHEDGRTEARRPSAGALGVARDGQPHRPVAPAPRAARCRRDRRRVRRSDFAEVVEGVVVLTKNTVGFTTTPPKRHVKRWAGSAPRGGCRRA